MSESSTVEISVTTVATTKTTPTGPDEPEQLSGVTVVIFIACGVLLFLMLFLFAKRQITRFTLKSRRGPHAPIGLNAWRSLKKEVELKIDRIPEICYEPRMRKNKLSKDERSEFQKKPFYFRMKAVDDTKRLELEVLIIDETLQRGTIESLRAFLIGLLSGLLNGADARDVHEYCDYFEHARFDPVVFSVEEYKCFSVLHRKLLELISQNKKAYSSTKSSPQRTPVKRSSNKHHTTGGQTKPASVDSAIEQDQSADTTLEDIIPGELEDHASSGVVIHRPRSLGVVSQEDSAEEAEEKKAETCV